MFCYLVSSLFVYNIDLFSWQFVPVEENINKFSVNSECFIVREQGFIVILRTYKESS